MSKFFNLVGENIRSYPQVKIGKTIEQFVQKAVLMRLGMTDLNALRDRYEGQSFLEKHRSRLFGNLAVREYRGEIIRSRSFKLIDDDENLVTLSDVPHKIQVCQFGEMPIMKSPQDVSRPIVLVYQRDIFWIHILGIISTDDAKNLDNYVKRGNYYEFEAFDKLESL